MLLLKFILFQGHEVPVQGKTKIVRKRSIDYAGGSKTINHVGTNRK